MNHNYSTYPCPICKQKMLVIGLTKKGEKLTSCGHSFKFKKTRSEKVIDRKYVSTPWGLELATKEGE
jgi:hypothetical protein